MPKISLKKQPLPVNLTGWVGLYDTEIRGNYAVEFLTAATYGAIEIPDAKRYQLPPDVEDKDLDETIEESVLAAERNEKKIREKFRSRKKSVIRGWRQGKKPWAIKCLDELREIENPEFRIDLLKPKLYDGTKSAGNDIPFAVDILPALAYLYASVLISGYSAETNKHIPHPNPKGCASIMPSSRLPKNLLEAKIEGVTTENRECEGVGLKQPYGNLLQLLGMHQKRSSAKTYGELGLGFIEKLVSWIEKERLNKGDYRHAKRTLHRFIEAFTDHRYGIYTHHLNRCGKEYIAKVAVLNLPGFRDKKTRDRFTDFFLRVWNVVNPDLPLNAYRTKMLYERRRTYHSHLFVKQEYRDRLEARFPGAA
jgi:hypothetical protein